MLNARGTHSDTGFRDNDDDHYHDPDYRAGGWPSCVIPRVTRQTERRGLRQTPGPRFFYGFRGEV